MSNGQFDYRPDVEIKLLALGDTSVGKPSLYFPWS